MQSLNQVDREVRPLFQNSETDIEIELVMELMEEILRPLDGEQDVQRPDRILPAQRLETYRKILVDEVEVLGKNRMVAVKIRI